MSSKNNPTRILIVSRDIEIGGMQRAAITLAQNLVNAGISVDYFCLFKRRDPEEFKEIDARIKLFQPMYYRETTPKWFYIVYNYLRLKSVSNQFKYDRILSFGEHFNGFNILALWSHRKRLFVLDRMNPELNCGFPNEYLRRNIYKYTKGLIAQTDFAKEVLYLKTHHPNIRVIRNFLSMNDTVIKELQEARFENSLMESPLPQLLFVGRLSPEKGVSTLIKSALKLINDDAKFQLNIVGEGVLMDELMLKYSTAMATSKRTTNENITPIISFHGAVSEPVGFFKSSHIFILPSLSEGFPNVLIEAMSAGMACIVSDRLKSKLPFLKGNENVVFFECENYMDLTDKINHILTDAVLWNKLSKNAMKLASWFQTDSILNEYLEVLDLNQSCVKR